MLMHVLDRGHCIHWAYNGWDSSVYELLVLKLMHDTLYRGETRDIKLRLSNQPDRDCQARSRTFVSPTPISTSISLIPSAAAQDASSIAQHAVSALLDRGLLSDSTPTRGAGRKSPADGRVCAAVAGG